MNCKKVERLLNLYVDKELPSDKVSELQGHLSGCQKCTNRFNELTQLKGLVKSVPEYTANPYLWTRISAALEKVPAIPRGVLIPNILKLWVPVACTLILVSLVMLANINKIEMPILKETPNIQKAILEIPVVPENMEMIALNLLVYTDNNMEVNYALF